MCVSAFLATNEMHHMRPTKEGGVCMLWFGFTSS